MGNFNIFVRHKVVDDQVKLAVMIDFNESNWPADIALGFSGSVDVVQVSGRDVEGVTPEVFGDFHRK